MAEPAPAASKAVSVEIRPRWDTPGKPFEGWGTALAWFANVTGKLPPAQREHLADLLYGADGLGWNIARYNIGGGNAPEATPYLRLGADIQGFWRRPPGVTGTDWWAPDDPAQWNWSADAGQRWWLDAVRTRVPQKDQIFEAFSNSPPYFMTVSGLVSGNDSGLDDNLRPGYEDRFADYLVRVTLELERRHHIHFRTLSPVNEPNTSYWYAANTQEGAHWSPATQSLVLKAVHKALVGQGADTEISAMDETNALTFVQDWAGLDEAARDVIGQLNAHSYDTTGKTAVRDIARATGKRLWMSEVDLTPPGVRQDFGDMRPAITLGEQIVSDINRLQPQAWVLWQAVERETMEAGKGSNWGLIKLDFANTADPAINVTVKYAAMANFSRYIRPGARFLPVDDTDTVVAVRPDGNSFVVVHVNPGLYERRLDIHFPAAKTGYRVTRIVTDKDHRGEVTATGALDAEGLSAPPLSVTTFIVSAQP
ncbi:MAG: glycoside hydrolase [Asticcacaulis sp.]|uniref:glycoside hydrolase n=1 Tax=Asticcacaulis sp. TaxID=1872648 RepID=UPI0039E3C2F4